MLDAGTVPKTDANKKSITSAALHVENKKSAPKALSSLEGRANLELNVLDTAIS